MPAARPLRDYFLISLPFAVISVIALIAGYVLTFAMPSGSLSLIGSSDRGNATYPLDFIAEQTAWTMFHFYENYMVCVLFTTAILPYFQDGTTCWRRFGYVLVVSIGLSLALLWEKMEAVATIIYKLFKYYEVPIPLPDSAIANSIESIEQIILSDTVQAITANVLGVITVGSGLLPAPPSCLLRHKRWYRVVLRIILYCLQLLDFLHVIQVTVGGIELKIPFYSLIFWKFFSLWLFYLDDLQMCSDGLTTPGQVNWNYTFIALFHLVMWASPLDVHYYPLLTTNLFPFCFVGVLIVLQHFYEVWREQSGWSMRVDQRNKDSRTPHETV